MDVQLTATAHVDWNHVIDTVLNYAANCSADKFTEFDAARLAAAAAEIRRKLAEKKGE